MHETPQVITSTTGKRGNNGFSFVQTDGKDNERDEKEFTIFFF